VHLCVDIKFLKTVKTRILDKKIWKRFGRHNAALLDFM